MCADKSAPATLDVTPEQQRVLERIAVQRERLRARHAARRQAQVRTHEAANAAAAADGAAPGGLYPPMLPLPSAWPCLRAPTPRSRARRWQLSSLPRVRVACCAG